MKKILFSIGFMAAFLSIGITSASATAQNYNFDVGQDIGPNQTVNFDAPSDTSHCYVFGINKSTWDPELVNLNSGFTCNNNTVNITSIPVTSIDGLSDIVAEMRANQVFDLSNLASATSSVNILTTSMSALTLTMNAMKDSTLGSSTAMTMTSSTSLAAGFLLKADKQKLDAMATTSTQLQVDWNATTGVKFIQNKPTLFDGVWNSLIGKPATTTPAVSYSARTLNSCFLISTTKDALVSYSVDIDTTATLSGGAVGTVTLRNYSDSGCATDGQTVQKAKAGLTGTLLVGLTVNNPATVTLGGTIVRGRYAKIETANTSGTPTFTFSSAQETQGWLVQ